MALVGILDEFLLLLNMYLQVVKFSSKRIVKTCLPEIKKYKQEERQKDKHQLVDEHNLNEDDDKRPQCGNSVIFLSLRFYVKSISVIVELQNLPF